MARESEEDAAPDEGTKHYNSDVDARHGEANIEKVYTE